MKKRLVVTAVVISVLVLFACAFIPASADETGAKAAPAKNVATAARFLNMLNHNFVYNFDFEDADIVAENSVLALLDQKEGDSDYISEAVLKGFINDMYGIELESINDNAAEHKEGLVFITPRGYTSYSHEITDVAENEDGSFTVYSSVTVTPHDNDEYVTSAETLFVKSETSAFGYNIIRSDLAIEGSEI